MTPTSGKAITARQAAVELLRDAGEPLKSAEIARRVLEVKDVAARGKRRRCESRRNLSYGSGESGAGR